MKSIKIHNKLTLQNGYVTTKNNDYVFLKQGHADGACGPYSLFMALIILGIITYDDVTNLWRVNRSTRFGKLIKLLEENHSQLFQEGVSAKDVEFLIKNSLSKLLVCKSNSNGDLIHFITSKLKKNNAVLVGVYGEDLEHWMVAIGYELDSEKNINKLFFLDPSGDEPDGYWNAVIDITKTKRRKYPYTWIDYRKGETKDVNIDEVIALQLI